MMIDRGRQRLPLLFALCLLGTVCVASISVFRGRPALAVGVGLLVCTSGYALFRIDRRTSLRLLCVSFTARVIGHFLQGVAYVGFAGLFLLMRYGWFKSQTLKSKRVKAAALAGVVECDSMRCSGMRVEECSADWIQQFSQVKTGDGGRFALPPRDGPVHYVRVSWPGTRTVHLQVELAPDAGPLLVRLKPRRASAF